MALYDYKCPKCQDVVPVSHSINENPDVVCEKCKTLRTKVFSAPAVQFRGNGWGHQ